MVLYARARVQTEARGESVDKKIRKLDGEIRGYGEQMRKMRYVNIMMNDSFCT